MILALGIVIFVHELGHFVVAKLCGVKCEKFYLGFDIAGLSFVRFKRGETLYGIGILPLGGYVKMLGQEDNPSRLREEIQRARLQREGAAAPGPAGSASDPQDAAAEPPLSEAEVREAEQALYNPRSYLAKSVPQRMAIISAGVIMNLIFAFLVAMWAYGLGVKEPACVVEVTPGGAAWREGIRSGDRILKVAGEDMEAYRDLLPAISLGELTNGVPLLVRRPGVADPFTVVVHPEFVQGMPKIGVIPSRSTVLAHDEDTSMPDGSPAAQAQGTFKSGDQIEAINGQAVASAVQLNAQLLRHANEPIRVTVFRPDPAAKAGPGQEQGEHLTIRVGPNPMRTLGLVMTMGPIAALQTGSPADKIDLRPGDLIEGIETWDAKKSAWQPYPLGDPMSLGDRLAQIAGTKVRLRVRRSSGEAVASALLTNETTLRPVDWIERPILSTSPASAPALGIAYRVSNEIHAVVPGSPAAAAGLQPGESIVAAEIIPPAPSPDHPDAAQKKALKIEFSAASDEGAKEEKKCQWPIFFFALQALPAGSQIELTLSDGRKVELAPAAAKDWYNPDRGFVYRPEMIEHKADSLSKAIRLGAGRRAIRQCSFSASWASSARRSRWTT